MDSSNKEITVPGDLSREDLFIRLLAVYENQGDAAIAAGYSESYSKTSISEKFKSKTFLAKLKSYYNNSTYSLLPKIAKVESDVVQLVVDNPEDISKYRHTIKEIKQSAGILRADEEQRQSLVSVKNIQNILLNVHQVGSSEDSGPIKYVGSGKA
jgi:hypothetical protein